MHELPHKATVKIRHYESRHGFQMKPWHEHLRLHILHVKEQKYKTVTSVDSRPFEWWRTQGQGHRYGSTVYICEELLWMLSFWIMSRKEDLQGTGLHNRYVHATRRCNGTVHIISGREDTRSNTGLLPEIYRYYANYMTVPKDNELCQVDSFFYMYAVRNLSKTAEKEFRLRGP